MPRTRVPIRALLVDYGEVLCGPPDARAFEAMAVVAGTEVEPFTEAYWQLRPAYDRGELDGPAYWRLVGKQTGAPIDEGRAADLVERDIALWTTLDQHMLEWVDEVAAKGLPVGLISNMVPEIGTHLRDTMRAFDGFATVTYSYELGVAKPDPGIYHHALRSLGASPQETLLVDDRLPNVESAQALGLHAHRFASKDALVADVERLYAFVSGTS